jgi:5'(3')-deoxyribonucleotidase
MDGVQAVYGSEDTVGSMEQRGYFLNRPVHHNTIQLVRHLLQDEGFRVVILTAVFQDDHSLEEKQRWLKARGLGNVETCFVPCGESKGNYVEHQGINLLIDDFSKNLFEWEKEGTGFYGIKFENGINGTKGTWRAHGGFRVDYRMSGEELYQKIQAIAGKLRAA